MGTDDANAPPVAVTATGTRAPTAAGHHAAGRARAVASYSRPSTQHAGRGIGSREENSLNHRATILWRRLDLPGHEAAQLEQTTDGWDLSGVAVLAHDERPCRIEYEIHCDAGWRTRRCMLRGIVGTTSLSLEILRSVSGEWTVDGIPMQVFAGCEDIDLGFSPSTNLLPIRRLGLEVSASASVRAVWVRFPSLTTQVLEQHYTRLTQDRYLYESGGGRFRRELTVDEVGFVLDYPGIWVAEARGR